MTERTYELSTFSLTEMAECASAIRRCGNDALSMAEAADAITTFLRRRLVDDRGQPAAVLVRTFATAPLHALEPQVQAEARRLDPRTVDDTRCLTLLATSGDVGSWNDRRASVNHQVIPLTDTERVRRLPMIEGLLSGLGLDIGSVVAGQALQTKEAFGVFHVERAVGSELIPDQGFVRQHGVQSAIGFGGVLPSQRVFAIVLFSRESISSETAELFGPIGISVRLALLPFDSGALFSGDPALGPGPRDVRAESVAYAQLLEAFESTATAQASRLEHALENARRHQERVQAEARVVETLHHVGSSLAGQLDLDQVIDVTIEATTAVTGARSGAFLYSTGDDSGDGSYRLYQVAGVSTGGADDIAAHREALAAFESDDGRAGAIRSDDITQDAGLPGGTKSLGLPSGVTVRSYLAVPVVSTDGAVRGGIFLGHEQPGVFDERDQRLAEGIASQASTAIETARLYRAEREARRSAELAAGQLSRLQASTAALAQATTVDDVAEIVVTEGATGLDASSATFFLERGGALHAVASHGNDAFGTEAWRVVQLRPGLPLTDALAADAPLFFANRAELASAYPALANQPSASAAHAVLPFATAGRERGAIVFSWPSERRASTEDRQFMLALSSQCSQAIDRANLAEAERTNARRQQFLSEASKLLAGTLDTEETIATAAQLCIGDMAMSATVHLLDDDGIHLRAARAADTDLNDHLGRILADEPIRTTDARLLQIIEDAVPVRLDRLEGLDVTTGVDRGWAVTGEAKVAAAAVPLKARMVCFGVLTVTREEPYDDGELALLRDLADRIAVAIDNARLHEQRSETAILLQRSLLPPHLPGIPGMEVDVRYRALARESELGGDFYDVFRISPGKWGIVIGDVCGKGIAAASLTALARFTARAAALGGASVSKVIDVVNRAVLDEGVEDRFCTMIAMAVEPDHAGGALVRLAIGGHPLPLVVSPDAPPHPVGDPGMVVGLFDDAQWSEQEIVLRQRESIVLYTDGVTEARSPAGEFAPDLLRTLLQRIGPASATTIVERVEREVLAFEHGEQRDDMAVLCLRSVGSGRGARTPPLEFERRFPPISASVPMARHEVASWLARTGVVPEDVAGDVLLVVSELATNAMRAARSGFHLRLWLEGASVVLELADDGAGFDEARANEVTDEPDLMGERGRGLFLLHQLADDATVESNESGTVVRARRRYADG